MMSNFKSSITLYILFIVCISRELYGFNSILNSSITNFAIMNGVNATETPLGTNIQLPSGDIQIQYINFLNYGGKNTITWEVKNNQMKIDKKFIEFIKIH